MLLETNYRERLHMVTNEVKRRLDYQIALQNLHRRMEQDHMINWVEKSVISSITPQQVSPVVKSPPIMAAKIFLAIKIRLFMAEVFHCYLFTVVAGIQDK